MKFLRLLYLMALMVLGTSLWASAQTAASGASTVTYKDNTVFWRDSVLVHHQSGQFTPVSSAIKYPNGTTISADGTVQLANGKTQKLKLHQALSPQGKIVLAADDIFTVATIQQTEQQVVGDTETKLFMVNGQLTSVTSGAKAADHQQYTQRQIALLEKMNALLEKRATLVEASLTEEQRMQINAQRNLLDAKIAAIDRRLKGMSSTASQ